MNFSGLDEFQLGYTSPGSQLKDHIYERSRQLFAEGDAARDALSSPEAVRQRQGEIRAFITESLGGLPPSDTPLNACTRGTVQGDGFVIEKVVFESRPRHYVTAHLYLPNERPERCPAVLFLCGHAEVAKEYERYQSVCQSLAQAGLIVLAQDPVGQGERFSYCDADTPGESKPPRVRWGTSEHDYAGAQCRFVGDSLGRYFLHDAMRSVDYLISRPEVDPERIGVTGNSGGGTQTSLMMMADPRIAAAAPGTFIMNRESYQRTGQAQDAEQIWPGFTAAGYDHEDILLAMAPKPVCVLTVQWDFFPIEGARRTVERSRRLWEMLGASDNLELVEDPSLHQYSPALARASARFFSKHLLGRELDSATLAPKPFAAGENRCTTTGQVKTDYADAEFIFEANLGRAKAAATERQKLAQHSPTARRARAVEWLQNAVSAHRLPSALNPRLIGQKIACAELSADVAFWYTQPNLANLGMLFRSHPPTGNGKQGVTVALWDDGTNALQRHATWLRQECAKGRAVLVLNLSGMGPLRPDSITPSPSLCRFYETFHKLADDLTWMGDSLAALRTYEMTRVVELLALWPGLDLTDIRTYAHGRTGVYARLAAAAEPRLGPCEWRESFTFSEIVDSRYYDEYDIKSLTLPDALRYFDLDEL